MLVAAGFVLGGLLILWQASLIKDGMMRDPVGPRAAFYLCGGMLVVGGLAVILRNLLAIRSGHTFLATPEGTPDTEGYPASFRRAAALAGVCFAYALLLQPLGYLIATPLFILASLRVLDQRSWARNLVVALLFTVAAYLVFAMALGVRMPHGPLTDLFRQWGIVRL
jgi:putative tricarboxylic transport membrane protein